MKSLLAWVLIVIIILAAGGLWYWNSQPAAVITSFEECAGAGNPVMESYPAQCRTKDGQHFVQEIGNELEKADLVQVTSPRPGQTISHDVTVTGQARGTWYFEASFPMRLEDPNGNVIVQSFAQAEGEWMTETFVPFSGALVIPESFHGDAILRLEKDNPSGLPEHADTLWLPVIVQ
jgi:hypothetical protein